jgi:hypothetical protein
MNQLDPGIVKMLRDEIIRCIKELLETKHLYQSVRIDTTGIQKLIDNVEESEDVKQYKQTIGSWSGMLGDPGSMPPSPKNMVAKRVQELRQKIEYTTAFILGNFWSFSTDACKQPPATSDTKPKEDITNFVLPTVSVLCEKCDGMLPHNSGFRGQTQEFQTVSFIFSKDGKQVPFQTFVFPYQCQGCKEEPLVFLVHREGIKLTLAGCNHIEKVQVPKTIPKEEGKYFSEAIVAFNTGNVLAGLFLLRTTIDQYMRRILKVKGRKTGDELAGEYATLLHDEFPKSYPSMKVIYEELSIVLHSADANSTQFEKSKQDIENHFELLKFHPLRTRKRKRKAQVKKS